MEEPADACSCSQVRAGACTLAADWPSPLLGIPESDTGLLNQLKAFQLYNFGLNRGNCS